MTDVMDELFPKEEIEEDSIKLKFLSAATKPYDSDKLEKAMKVAYETLGRPRIPLLEFILVVVVLLYLPVIISVLVVSYCISPSMTLGLAVVFLVFTLLVIAVVKDYSGIISDYLEDVRTHGYQSLNAALDVYIS